MNWPTNKKGSAVLVHDEEIQRHVPAEDWDMIRGVLDMAPSTKVYATRFGCRDRKAVEASLAGIGFTLPAYRA